jgi:hypothetical protein
MINNFTRSSALPPQRAGLVLVDIKLRVQSHKESLILRDILYCRMQDVLCTIVSKLPPQEISRASVLSSQWRYISDICCFKLRFSGTAGYRDNLNR